jgi:hypothetical protein
MKVYVAKILIEGRHYNNCSVKLSTDLNEIKNYATNQIDAFADINGGKVTERTDLRYVMLSNDIKVTIKIEEHEV